MKFLNAGGFAGCVSNPHPPSFATRKYLNYEKEYNQKTQKYDQTRNFTF